MSLPYQIDKFVLHCGEMGSRWGFNRTVGQMLGLLVVNPDPLKADDIGELLRISRGNVSMGIKELQSWRLVQVHHLPGDRKDYYSASGSIWELAKTIFEERSKREITPTISLLRDALQDENDPEVHEYSREKMQEIHDLLELLTTWANALNDMNPDNLRSLMRLGSGINKLLELKGKITNNNK